MVGQGSEHHALLPIAVWEKTPDIPAMDALAFRALHRKFYYHKQKLESTKATYDMKSVEKNADQLRAREELLRARRNRHAEEEALDLKKENLRLVERLCWVMRESEARQKMTQTPRTPSTAPVATGTLNLCSRRNTAKKIDRENKAMLDRLIRVTPSVATREELTSRYQVHHTLVTRNSRLRRTADKVDLLSTPPPQAMQPGHRRPTPPWRKLRLVPQLANTASSQEPQEQAADAKMVEPERKTPIKPSGTPSRQGSRPGSRPASKAQKLDSSTASVPEGQTEHSNNSNSNSNNNNSNNNNSNNSSNNNNKKNSNKKSPEPAEVKRRRSQTPEQLRLARKVAQEEVGKVGAQVAERLYSKPSALTPTQAKPKSRATAPSQQTSRPTTPRTESASSRPEGALPKEVTATGALEKEALAPEPSAANASMAQVPAFPEAEELTTTEATPNRTLLPGELASTAHKDDEEAAPKDDEEAEFEEEKDDEYDDDDGFEEDNEYDNDDGFEEEADDDDNNNHTNNHNNNNDDGFEEDADESISPTSAHSTWKVAEATAGSEEVSDGGSVAQLETTPVASAPLSPSVAPSRGGSADRDEYEDFEEDSSDGKGRGGGGGALEEEEPSSPLLGDFSEGPESPTTTADFGDVIAPGRPESPTTTTPTTPTAAPTTIPPTTTPAPTATTATTPPTTPTPTTTTTPLPPTAPTAAATAAEPGRRSPGQEPEKEDFFEVDELSEESLGEQPEQQRQYSFAQHGDEDNNNANNHNSNKNDNKNNNNNNNNKDIHEQGKEQVVEQVEEHNEEKMDGHHEKQQQPQQQQQQQLGEENVEEQGDGQVHDQYGEQGHEFEEHSEEYGDEMSKKNNNNNSSNSNNNYNNNNDKMTEQGKEQGGGNRYEEQRDEQQQQLQQQQQQQQQQLQQQGKEQSFDRYNEEFEDDNNTNYNNDHNNNNKSREQSDDPYDEEGNEFLEHGDEQRREQSQDRYGEQSDDFEEHRNQRGNQYEQRGDESEEQSDGQGVEYDDFDNFDEDEGRVFQDEGSDEDSVEFEELRMNSDPNHEMGGDRQKQQMRPGDEDDRQMTRPESRGDRHHMHDSSDDDDDDDDEDNGDSFEEERRSLEEPQSPIASSSLSKAPALGQSSEEDLFEEDSGESLQVPGAQRS